jgi:hypothetical protein
MRPAIKMAAVVPSYWSSPRHELLNIKSACVNRCTKAVEITMPVPNCLRMTKIMLFCEMMLNRVVSTGRKTPAALVTRMTKSRPTRSGIL